MGKLAEQFLTLNDLQQRLDPDGKIAKMIDVIDPKNDILADMPWHEGNMADGHKTTVVASYPEGIWRRLYEGVPYTKGATAQVKDTCGELADKSLIDAKLVQMALDKAAFRLGEDSLHIKGLKRQLAEMFFYGNTDTDPEKILGFAPRYGSLTGANSENIIDASGAGTGCTSVYIIGWGVDTCFGLYPKGSKAGLEHNDRGEVDGRDADGNEFRAFRTDFKWDAGLCLRNWRSVARIANIKVADLQADASAGANLINCLIRGLHKVNKSGSSNIVIYANDDITTYLDLQTVNHPNVRINYGPDQFGQEIMKFRGKKVRQCDSLLSAETAIS